MAATRRYAPKINSVTTKQKIKSVENLQPIKRHFDRVETERVYRIIQDGVSRMKELQALYQLISDDAKIFSISDIKVRDPVLRHQNIVQIFSATGCGQNALKESVRDIMRCICNEGISLACCLKKDITLEELPFYNYLQELSKITHEKLLTEAEEETARNKFLLQIMEKARNAQKTTNSLAEVLKEKKNSKDHQLNEKDRVIRQLKRDLDSMMSAADEEKDTTLNEAAKQILTEHKTLENKQSKQNQEIINLKDRLNKQRDENYASESKLRKRKFKMSGELQNWIMKYDQDMGWRQDQIEEIKKLNEQDLEEIKQIEIHFVELQKDYDAIMTERRLKREEIKRKEREDLLKNYASVKIQAMWRGYQSRKDLNGKKNIKAKGKKDGNKK